jgi:hypothetical protein
MGGKYMSEEINHDPRRFWGTAVMTIAAAELVMISFADAQSSKISLAAATTIKPGTNTSFGSLKQINACVNQTGSSPVQKLSRAVQPFIKIMLEGLVYMFPSGAYAMA